MGNCEMRRIEGMMNKKVVVIVNNGYQMSGTLVEHDEGILVLQDPKDGKEKILFKMNISTIYLA